MKKIIYVLICSIFLCSCSAKDDGKKTENENTSAAIEDSQQSSTETENTNNTETTANASKEPEETKAPETKASESNITVPATHDEDYFEFIGYWQLGQGIGSGYGARYAFNENGTFWWACSQMTLDERLVAKKGTWIFSDGKIYLTLTDEYTIEGGEIVDDPISGSGKAIKGGELKQKSDLNQIYVLTVTMPEKTTDTDQKYFALDGVEYFNYDAQPDFFDIEFFNK